MLLDRTKSYLPILLIAPGPLYLAIDSLLTGLLTALLLSCCLAANLLVIFPIRYLFAAESRLLLLLLFNSTVVIVLELLLQSYAFSLQQKLGIFLPLLCINSLVLSYAEQLFKTTNWREIATHTLTLSLLLLFFLAFFGGCREILETYSLLADVSQFSDLQFSGIQLLERENSVVVFTTAAGTLFLLGALLAVLLPLVDRMNKSV